MAQLVEHHLAKVRVAGSNPVVRSERVSPSPCGEQCSPGGVAERRGNGLQIRVHGFKSRLHLGRLAQRERASLTRKRSLVQIQYRPPVTTLVSQPFETLAQHPTLGPIDLSAKLCRPIGLAPPSKSSLMVRDLGVMTGRSSFRYTRSLTLHRFCCIVQPLGPVAYLVLGRRPG